MRFQRLDLNLLVALDALLTERSVSMAADRLCLSQSATSSALGRLRDYFGDDLLVLKGRQMVLTSRAEDLVEPVKAVLEQIRSTIAVAPPFEPANCDRLVRIMASDYSTEVLLSDAFRIIAGEAPDMRFEVQIMDSEPLDALERGMIDLLLTVDYALSSDHPLEILFQDDYVVIADCNNPLIGGPLTPELYLSLGHVTARFGRSRVPSFDDWFSRRQKQHRKIELIVSTFTSVPSLILGTNRIATVHRKLAEKACRHLPLNMFDVPFDIPPIRQAVQWHMSNNSDPVLRWVVDRLADIAAAGNPPLNADAPPAPESAAFAAEVQLGPPPGRANSNR